jgi:hypothetical protein
MRLLIINILATAMLLFGAASAGAWSVTMTENTSYDGQLVTGSEFVVVDVYIDVTDFLLNNFSYAIMYDSTILSYEGGLSSSPGYILYSPASGAQAATYMFPLQNPPIEWNGIPTAGGPGGQVNLNWGESDLIAGALQATGLNVYIATLVFHVTGAAGDGIGEIFPQVDANGWALKVGGVNLPANTTTPVGGIAVITPEPTTALLVGLGLIGLGVAGRRRA